MKKSARLVVGAYALPFLYDQGRDKYTAHSVWGVYGKWSINASRRSDKPAARNPSRSLLKLTKG